ncbi:histidine kinase [Fluviicola sp. SGL-29]|nr:histidine kinase [Fluviicola sp. SGL-29]
MMYKSALSVRKEILLHLVFWLVWVYFTLAVVDSNGIRFAEMDLFSSTWCITYVVTFYVNYLFVLPKVFHPFKWIKAIAGLIVIFLFFAGLRYFLEQFLTVQLFNVQNYNSGTGTIYYIYDNIFYAARPVILSSVFWIVVLLVRVLDYNKYIIEEQKNTEIKFLKAQINPHFVFNTLNNIYSMVHFQSPNALPAIEKLSSIMRFTTYEALRNFIRLAEELNYIHAYIELEELRHYDKSFVNWETAVQNDNCEIPPYLLSPLVENALKHGSYTAETPITIRLSCNDQQLDFEVINRIGNQKKDKLGGIGIDNLKNRLEILYPEKHTLQTTEQEGLFSAHLVIYFQ